MADVITPVAVKGMTITSPKFQLISEDWSAWGKRTIQTLAPYLVVLIPVVISKLPTTYAYYDLALFLLQRLLDILRRYVASTTYAVTQ